jgi:hypothetical protein
MGEKEGGIKNSVEVTFFVVLSCEGRERWRRRRKPVEEKNWRYIAIF